MDIAALETIPCFLINFSIVCSMLDANENIRGVMPDTIPMSFIKELRSLGLRVEGSKGWLYVAQNTIPSDSP